MENFPIGADGIPTKLSPYADEDVDSLSTRQHKLSRSTVSIFDTREENLLALEGAECAIPQYYLRSTLNGESEFKLKQTHIKQFSLQTLFYAFYQLPKDLLQSLAAQELNSRGWRYHTQLSLWFRPATANDNIPNSSPGQKQFMYFDTQAWSPKLFTSVLDQSKLLGPGEYSLSSTAPNFSSLKAGPSPKKSQGAGLSIR
jgi:hypothetical protein